MCNTLLNKGDWKCQVWRENASLPITRKQRSSHPNRINLFLGSTTLASTLEFSAYTGPQGREKRGYSPCGMVNIGYLTILRISLIHYNLTDGKLQGSRESPMIYNYLQPYVQISQIQCWMRKTRHKRVHIAWFYLYKVWNWAKLISAAILRDWGHPSQSLSDKKGAWGEFWDWNTLFLDLEAGYQVFSVYTNAFSFKLMIYSLFFNEM